MDVVTKAATPLSIASATLLASGSKPITRQPLATSISAVIKPINPNPITTAVSPIAGLAKRIPCNPIAPITVKLASS